VNVGHICAVLPDCVTFRHLALLVNIGHVCTVLPDCVKFRHLGKYIPTYLSYFNKDEFWSLS
jgi:hypothetical protein